MSDAERKALNDWYEVHVGYRPDEDEWQTIDELRDRVTEMKQVLAEEA